LIFKAIIDLVYYSIPKLDKYDFKLNRKNVLIKQDEIAAENGNDKLITSFKVNEYDAFMNLKKKNEATLKQQGLSSADIQNIKDFDADNIITELKNKSDKELKELGYTEERIENIKDYDGTDVSIQGIFSDLYINIKNYWTNSYKIPTRGVIIFMLISLFTGFSISFILFLLMTSITSHLGEIALIVYSLYLLIALIISSSILIIGMITKHSSNKQD